MMKEAGYFCQTIEDDFSDSIDVRNGSLLRIANQLSGFLMDRKGQTQLG